nr:Protein D2085.5, isoform h [Haemonchus contortus]
MVDVFYGDRFVPIDFKESDILVQKWTMATPNPSLASEVTGSRPRSDFSREKASTVTDSTGASRDTRDTDGTLTHDMRSSFSSSSSAKEGRSMSDMTKRSVRTKHSESVIDDHSGANMSASQHSQHSQHLSSTSASRHTNEQISPKTAESVSQGRATDAKQSVMSGDSSLRPLALQFVVHTLAVNPAYTPWVDEKGPKAERILDLTMEWLLAAACAKSEHKAKAEVTDDVISSLSLHSLDLDDVPEAMIAGGGNKRRSIASSASSTAGDSSKTEAGNNAFYSDGIDGVSAGRAAAIAALTRIVCSKRTNEKLPNQQLARFLSAIHDALVEKDRLVLCSLFFYGQNLFRLGLPGVEAILPHYLFALDIILIESAKIRLHPSIPEVEVRRACLRGLSSVVCWPTTFGMSKIPQLPESANLKSSAASYLQLRSRVYKTLVFSLRNETDPINLHLTLAMCTVLMEESCSFDLGLTEEQTREMVRMAAQQHGNQTTEKGLCVSFVRGLVSAICDRICRPEWTGEHSVSLAAIDVLNCLSHLHPTVLFNNKDVSTGSLIVASLCRFIETQLNKPPPLHSKDLHSTVVAAYNSIAVWLNAAPILAECESVLNTVAEAVQLGVTGSKRKDSAPDDCKAASKRVLEAAEYLMYSLFSVVGRTGQTICDERRLLYTYGPAAIDTTKFLHVIVNGDTLLSLHEASHIKELADGCPCVLYIRRSPMQPASAGVAKLRPHPDGYKPEQQQPPAPLSSTFDTVKAGSAASSQLSKPSDSLSVASSSTAASNVSGSSTISKGSQENKTAQSVAAGSILSGVSTASVESSRTTVPVSSSSMLAEVQSTRSAASAPQITVSHVKASPQPSQTTNSSIGDQFEISPEFLKVSCKLDTSVRPLEASKETDAIEAELRRIDVETPQQKAIRERNRWTLMSDEDRRVKPALSPQTCKSIRILLYDMGLVDRVSFGKDIVCLDSGQSSEFYRSLHEMVDSCPARALHTTHIFYVKEGQRSAVDILENAANVQNTRADFCGFLAGLGEGVEIGVHDSWTGHWSTAFSSERKPFEEPDAVDHYIVDGVTHAIWWTDSGSELVFVLPTERSLRAFKQDLSSPAVSSRRGSSKTPSAMSVSSEDAKGDNSLSAEVFHETARKKTSSSIGGSEREKEGLFSYGGGGSSMGNAPPTRKSAEVRVMLVWLERAEDMLHFPVEELLSACDDGGDRVSNSANERPGHLAIFVHQVEPGLVNIRTKGTANRFGEAGPLCDSMVVSLASLPSLVRLTVLNIVRRKVAEIDNYQFTHTKRRQAIIDFGKKYAANLTYEDFLLRLMMC